MARRAVVVNLAKKSPRKRKNYVPVKVVKIPKHEEEYLNGYHWDDEDEDYDDGKEDFGGKSPVNFMWKMVQSSCVHVTCTCTATLLCRDTYSVVYTIDSEALCVFIALSIGFACVNFTTRNWHCGFGSINFMYFEHLVRFKLC